MPNSPVAAQVAAHLATLIALSLLVGWYVAFRSRTYVGWLGLSFAFIAALLQLRRAEIAVPVLPFALLAGASFVMAFLAAVKETRERLQDLRARHRAAEEAFLEMIKAGLAKEAQGGEKKDEG